MSLFDLEQNESKYRTELLDKNYDYLHAIKSNDLSKYKSKEDLQNIKKLSEYFFSTIPLYIQNNLLKAYERTPLKLPHEGFLDEYVHYLNARIFVEKNL